MPETKNKRDIVLSTINNRKSVRSFIKSKPVSKEDLVELVKIGMSAPSAKNAQAWEFIIINDPNVIKQIIQIEGLTFVDMLTDCENAIVVAANTDREYKDLRNLWVMDLAAASENMLIAAEGMGLGACWCTIYPMENRMNKFKEILNLPSVVTPFNIICVGHPTGYDVPQSKWNARRIHWNKWSVI